MNLHSIAIHHEENRLIELDWVKVATKRLAQ